MSFGEDLHKIIDGNFNGLTGKHHSWQRVKADHVIDLTNGFAFKSKYFNSTKGVPLLRIRDILKGRTETYFDGPIDPKAEYVKKGEIVVGMDGDFNSLLWSGEKALLNQRVCKVNADEKNFDQKFLAYLLPGYLSAIHKYTSSVTVKHLSSNTIKEIPLPLPPLNEQKRIVDKIERLFSDLDEGEALLKTIQKQLATYRQSVLKAAVTGELTKDWREANKHRLESGEDLLKRILKTRRDSWNGKGQYKEPLVPQKKPHEIPENWALSIIEQLSFVETGATPKKGKSEFYKDGTIPWITSTSVNQDPIADFQGLITEFALEKTNVKIIPKGSLILAMYGEGKTRGSVSELGIDAGTNQACAALVCTYISKDIKNYLKIFLKYNYENIRLKSIGGVQPNLNLGIIKDTQVPFPPEEEQEQIVNLIEDAFSQIDALEKWCDTELARSQTLRQSILKDAFSGKLVPQDPNDEPASELLKRIQAERDDQTRPETKSKNRKRKPTEAA